MGGRALIVDSDETHARAVAEVLGRAVRDVVTVTELAQAPAGDFELVVANFDGLGVAGASALLGRFQDLRARGRVLLFVGTVDRAALAGLFGEHGLSNVLARNGELDAGDLTVTVQKILRGDVFGIDKYFPADASLRHVTVRGSSERETLLVTARAFALGAGAQARFADLLCNACDEMLTNALYNAPVDEHGRPRFAQLSRINPVQLEPDEAVTVTLASDGSEMGISVVDPFGSLNRPGTGTGTLVRPLALRIRDPSGPPLLRWPTRPASRGGAARGAPAESGTGTGTGTATGGFNPGT